VPNAEDDALDNNSTAANNGLYANHMQEWEPDLYVDSRRSSHGGSFNSPELRTADKP